MPYRYFDVEFHQAEHLSDLKMPINVFNTFVTALGDNITGSNFNKYFDPEMGIVHPQISIRFNFENKDENKVKETVFEVAERLKNTGQIRHFEPELRDWIEPDFVIKAHEIGTVFAVELKNWMDQNSDVYQYFQTNPRKRAGFIVHLIYLALKHARFDVPIVWSILRESPTYKKDELLDEERIVSLARVCATKYEEGSRDVEKQSIPDFLERFVHAFINCVAPETEGAVLNWLRNSQFWSTLANSWNAELV